MNIKIEIVTIGDELLIGQVIDTNSAWIGQELNKVGLEVSRINSISDSENEIIDILNETSKRANVVLITGGLGPTKADITKATLCKFFDTTLVFNSEVYDNVKSLLSKRVSHINELNKQQAMVPANCTVINNPVGTAPIMWFEHNNTVFVSMPGVPFEMKHAMENEIIPRLLQKFNAGVIVHKTLLVHNIPEAVLAEKLSDFEKTIPAYIKLAYLPSFGRINLRFTGRGNDKVLIENTIDALINDIKPIIGNSILSYKNLSIPELVADIFTKNNLTLATAESCTGGNISHVITSLSGSSLYFKGSIIAYHNNVKTNILGVDKKDIETYGAVSKHVVEQMAQGARKILNTDYAVATSGVAGPDGGSEEKPVGTVWIAVASAHGTISEKYYFGKTRIQNIIRATDTALIMLKKMVDTYQH